MTQTFKQSRKIVSGVGWSNPLTHDFPLENSSHLKLYADDVLLQLGVDYTLDEIGNPAGYEINIVIPDPGDEPPWWGNSLFILSVEPPIDQGDDLSLGGSFGVKFEVALDKLTRRLQSVHNMVVRAVKTPIDIDPDDLDQDDITVDPGTIPELLEASAAAVEAANSAEEDAAQTAADRVATGQDRVQTGLDRAVTTADRGTVEADKGIVAADKAIVAADKATTAGYRDEADDDRVAAQTANTNAHLAADAAADSAAEAQEAVELVYEYGDFNNRYIGEHAVAPTNWNSASPLDPGTDALVAGLIYYDTVSEEFQTYTGSVWSAGVATTDFARLSQNGADYDAAAFRTQLDLYSKAEVDGLPAAASAKTTPINADSLQIVDSADANSRKRLTFANLIAWLQGVTLTLSAKLTTVASASGGAGFNLPHGASPSAPSDGDIWTTTSGLAARINGATRTFVTTVRAVNTQHSLTGGGNLSADRTISLENDSAAPGNNKVYGTDASGNRGWKNDPGGKFTWQTGPAPTSGTAHDVTVPSTAEEIVIILDGVSLSGTDDLLVQLGDVGGIETNGYNARAVLGSGGTTSTAGFPLYPNGATASITGEIRLTKDDGNRWSAQCIFDRSNGGGTMSGLKTLSDPVTTVRLTRSGTNNFDGSGTWKVGHR